MSKPKISVTVPSSGWVVENIAPWGTGKIQMSNTATVNVTVDGPKNRKYDVSLSKPANAPLNRAKVVGVTVLEDTDEGEMYVGDYTPDCFDISLSV